MKNHQVLIELGDFSFNEVRYSHFSSINLLSNLSSIL